MLFGLIHIVEPLKEVLDRERLHLVEELVDEALASEEILDQIESLTNLSVAELRSDTIASAEKLLETAASEEQALREELQNSSPDAYHHRHSAGAARLREQWLMDGLFVPIAATLLLGGPGGAAWFLIYNAFSSVLFATIGGVVAALGVPAAFLNLGAGKATFRMPGIAVEAVFMLIPGVTAGYAGYQLAGGGTLGIALAAIVTATGIGIIFILEFSEIRLQVQDVDGAQRYLPTTTNTREWYARWRHALQEAGVLAYLRDRINKTLLARYSTVLSVRAAPGLRYLGDLKYHVPTSSREELFGLLSGVDGGSFALAGPRGAGKTILMRAVCEGSFSDQSSRDLGVFVSAPVGYEGRDFVLYLYGEICRMAKEYFDRITPPRRRRRLLRWIEVDTPAHALARHADQKRGHLKFLQTFSSEVSAKGGVKFAELSTRLTASRAEQPLTYPELIADLRRFLQLVADGVDGRVIIGIDELDRIGSGDRARKFLDDIKAIFWVRGCYFLVSVSEDALRTLEMSGHGFRDAFDSAFDEVVVVEHLDFAASTTLLRARVAGMSLPYHALAYCMSGGLPRELMRAARAIVDQYTAGTEVNLGRATANLVTSELNRHNRAARLALADLGAEAAQAAELLRRLDEGCTPTDPGLQEFADGVTAAARNGSEKIQALAEAVAAHAHYLAALAAVFGDGLTERDIRWATDKTTPAEARFSALSRARRYLGVNDAFARMLVDGFRATWQKRQMAVLVGGDDAVVEGVDDGGGAVA